MRANFKQLLDAGVHFGHQKRKWNPAMAPYVFMEKNSNHIIDLNKSVAKIEEAALSALEMTPPQLAADIYRTGIYLAGGGSMLRGLDKRIAKKTKLPVHVAEAPLRAVARGTSIALKNVENFQFLLR